MPAHLDVAALRLRVLAEPLTAAAFAPFGDVIENPRPDVQPSQYASAFGTAGPQHPYSPVAANQGSAIKYQHVSRPADRYGYAAEAAAAAAAAGAPSGRPSAPVANVFVCAARPLVDRVFLPVTILERHPFTTQTFVPLVDGGGPQRSYLVIVAPTRAGGGGSLAGPPDIHGLRAFLARGDQAVTYGAGTWHAPMAALGAEGTSLPFAVFQFANGVGDEDCQEVVLDGGPADPAPGPVAVRVPPAPPVAATAAAASGCPFASKL